MRIQGLWLGKFPEAAQLLNRVAGFEPISGRSHPIPSPLYSITLNWCVQSFIGEMRTWQNDAQRTSGGRGQRIRKNELEEIRVWARVADKRDLPLLINGIGDVGSWEVNRRRANETNQPWVSTGPLMFGGCDVPTGREVNWLLFLFSFF